MKIVIEYTLFVCTLLNYLSLKVASFVLKKKAKFCFLISFLASMISLICPLFSITGVLKILLYIFILTLVCLFSFGYKKFSMFVRDLAVVVFSTFCFGGACEGVENLIGRLPLLLVGVIGVACFFGIKIIIKSIDKANKIKTFTYRLKIIDGKKEVEEEGYLDSGNILLDGITKKPIILINFDVFHKLYDNISYISALTKTYDHKLIKNGHHQKINSIGGGGSILVFSVDEIQVGEDKSFKDVMLGLSFSGFEKSFGKKVLLNCGLI